MRSPGHCDWKRRVSVISDTMEMPWLSPLTWAVIRLMIVVVVVVVVILIIIIIISITLMIIMI